MTLMRLIRGTKNRKNSAAINYDFRSTMHKQDMLYFCRSGKPKSGGRWFFLIFGVFRDYFLYCDLFIYW